jgi:enamine deaminase RidA (YjgF/YER057c/UK114 family)
MPTVAERLAAIGRELPLPAVPLAGYVPAVRSGALIFTAGQLPLVNGTLLARGLVVDNADETVMVGGAADQEFVDIELACECAAIAALNAIAGIGTALEDLDRITRIVKVVGYVAGVAGFTSHPRVINGASELIADVWGGAGAHARSAVGVASLPLGSPVELELVVEVAE